MKTKYKNLLSLFCVFFVYCASQSSSLGMFDPHTMHNIFYLLKNEMYKLFSCFMFVWPMYCASQFSYYLLKLKIVFSFFHHYQRPYRRLENRVANNDTISSYSSNSDVEDSDILVGEEVNNTLSNFLVEVYRFHFVLIINSLFRSRVFTIKTKHIIYLIYLIFIVL